MAEVSIQKVDTRYRLPRSLRAERRRLDQLVRQVIDAACAETLEHLGLPEDSELCLRSIFVTVSLRLNSMDRALVDHWSKALALEIATAIRNGSTRRAIVYQSRRQALIDMAQGVGRGDLRRCWAWRQLGLWKLSGGATEAQATAELVRALCSESGLIVPTLSALASSGELQNVARSLTEQQWQALAAAAIGEGNVAWFFSQTGTTANAPAVREAQRVIGRSILLRSLAASLWFSEAREPVRRAVAVLVVLEVQPMLLQRHSAVMLISVIADAISKRDASSTEHTWSDAIEETISLPESESINPEYRAEDFVSTTPRVNDAVRVNESSTHETTAEGSNNESDDPKPLDLRQRAFTRWAGLLFLLGVLEDLKIPEAILEHPVLGKRDFSWALHQLALTLTGTDAHDPAALAFAGLPPNAKPPSITEEPASEDEATTLHQLVESILERLHLLLELESEVNLIEFVCRRRAQLVADPGWIEVRLSLDDISTELRRAGLDLNPGYISWLGIVVSFVYE